MVQLWAKGNGRRERGKSHQYSCTVQLDLKTLGADFRRTFPRNGLYRLNRGILRPEFDGFDGGGRSQWKGGTGLLADRSTATASSVTCCPTAGALGSHHFTRVFIAFRRVLIDQQEPFRTSDMNHIRMDSFTGVWQTIVAPSRGSSAAHDPQQLPMTMQDLALEVTSRRAQGSASHPRVTPIDTTITTSIRKETLVGSPLSAKTLYELDEPHEKQQNSANAQDSKINLPVDSPNQEEEDELPLKYPIAPQHCRRWGKPESYVISVLPVTLSDGMRC